MNLKCIFRPLPNIEFANCFDTCPYYDTKAKNLVKDNETLVKANASLQRSINVLREENRLLGKEIGYFQNENKRLQLIVDLCNHVPRTKKEKNLK